MDRGKVDVVGAGAMGRDRFVDGMGRDTDQRSLSKQSAGFFKGQRIEAEMNARGTYCERDVDPPVDDDFNFGADPLRGLLHLLGKGEPSLAVQVAIAELDSVDPSFDASQQKLLWAAAKAGSIGHEAELRAARDGQSRAIPSRGLEADA